MILKTTKGLKMVGNVKGASYETQQFYTVSRWIVEKKFRDIKKVYKYLKEEIKAHVIKCGGLHCSAIGQTCFSSALLPHSPPQTFLITFFAQT